MDLRLDVENAVQITAAFAQAPEIVMEELETAMGSVMQYLHRETMDRTPKDSGLLRAGFIPEVESARAFDLVVGTLSNALPYALPVELGTKPHFPPLAPLADWALRHIEYFSSGSGDDVPDPWQIARGIQRKIGRQGSPGYGMARFALLDGRETIAAEFAEAGARITARIEAAGNAGSAGGQA